MADLASTLITGLRARLRSTRRRWEAVMKQLSDADLNWRPNEESNSIANLVLHVAGNAGERFVAGIGGGHYVRNRDLEFASREFLTQAQLLAKLGEAFDAADAALANLDPARLLEPVQVRNETVPLAQVLTDTVAHYAEHLGQVMYVAKLKLGERYQTTTIPLPPRKA